MANDVIYYLALANELKKQLLGAKIDKIYQPESDELVIQFRSLGKQQTLYFCAKPDRSQAIITTVKRENPLVAPAYCMLLRKKLCGGTVKSVELYNCDRMIRCEISNRNELKDETSYYLIAELMGRYNNLVLTDGKNIVVDAMKRVPLGAPGKRYIMPGLPFDAQSHGKIRMDDEAGLSAVDWSGDGKTIASQISGVSKETATEITQLSINSSPKDTLKKLLIDAANGVIRPTVTIENGKVSGLFPFDYKSVSGERKYFDTLSDATAFYYSEKVVDGGGNDRTKELKKIADKLLTKFLKKRADCLEKMENTAEIDKNKYFGELIYNNIYKAKPNDSILICDDYCNSCTVNVVLDPTLSAAQNAEVYYKKYRKLKRAKEVAEQQVTEIDNQLNYLNSIVGSLSSASSAKELSEVAEELKFLSGKGRATIQKSKKDTPSAPLKCNIQGFAVYVGKNNLQNDAVTFKLADKQDIWLHAKDYHGSHVIIKTARAALPEDVLLQAAEVAAYYSQGKNAGKVQVDYTEKRFVKRNGTAPGMVYYTDFKSVYVEPKPFGGK